MMTTMTNELHYRHQARELDAAEGSCTHTFVDDHRTGDTVCVLCGKIDDCVGMVTMATPEDGRRSARVHHRDNHDNKDDDNEGDRLHHPLALRNEMYEALARMSGGDVAMIHIDRAMDLLTTLSSESTSNLDAAVRRMLRRLAPREGLERGVLAAVLHHALDVNGRKEELDFVAAVCGASRVDTLRAEKILELGRGYTHSASVRMSIVLNTRHLMELPSSWLAILRTAMTAAAEEAFCDLDTLVCAVGVYLSRSIKRRVMELLASGDGFVVDRAEMTRTLKKLSVKRLTDLYLVSASAVRRAIGALSATVRAIIDNGDILHPIAAASLSSG